MKREKNTPSTRVKSRRISTSSSTSSGNQNESTTEQQQKKTTTPRKGGRSSTDKPSNFTVRFQNADMLTKYRNKNPHIKIENPQTTSNFLANDISDDDEIWICEIPNSIDLNELEGTSIKLGSKKSLIKTENGQIECASSKFHDANGVYQHTLSIVSQENGAQLSVKNISPVGRMTLYKKIDDSDDTIELTPTGRHPCTIFPDNLVVRHPLLGRQFAEQINVSEAIKRKLAEATVATESHQQSVVRIKQEREENGNSSQTSPRKAKKRMADASDDSVCTRKLKKEIKTEHGHDDDLVRIKQIFEKSN